MTSIDLTTDSLAMFTDLANDAGNWSGSPLIGYLTSQQKGNLSDLIKKELIYLTYEDDGCAFAVFTDTGRAMADELNIDLGIWEYTPSA